MRHTCNHNRKLWLDIVIASVVIWYYNVGSRFLSQHKRRIMRIFFLINWKCCCRLSFFLLLYYFFFVFLFLWKNTHTHIHRIICHHNVRGINLMFFWKETGIVTTTNIGGSWDKLWFRFVDTKKKKQKTSFVSHHYIYDAYFLFYNLVLC